MPGTPRHSSNRNKPWRSEQIEGEAGSVLRPGDVFYEPEGTPIARFDATDEGVTFLGCFLLEPGQEAEMTMGRG